MKVTLRGITPLLRRLHSPRLVVLASFGGISVINYAFSLIGGWLLIPGDFGLLAFAQTVLLIAGLILNSGFAWSLTKALVGTAGDRRGALIRGALVANALLALAMGAALLGFFALGPLRLGLETWTIAAIVALTFPVLSCGAIIRAAAQGSQRFGAMAAIQVLEVVGKASGGVALMLMGHGVTGAITGFLLGALVAAACGLWVLIHLLGVRPWGASERPSLRIAGAQFGALLGLALLLNLDVLAVKLLAGPDRALAGQYQASIVLANTPYYLATALLPVLFTQLARAGGIGATAPAVGEALRLALLILFPIEIGLFLVPDRALGTLFPRAYAAGAPALRVLALGNCAVILVAILSTAFQATDRVRVPAVVLPMVTACEAITLRAVVPRSHTVGAASLFTAASAAACLLLGAAYLRALDRRTIGRVAVWVSRYLVALSVGGAVAVGGLGLGSATVASLGLGAVCYAGIVALLRLAHMPAALDGRGGLVPSVAEQRG
jgi:O-antigen/teichoic acid export membrane protein